MIHAVEDLMPAALALEAIENGFKTGRPGWSIELALKMTPRELDAAHFEARRYVRSAAIGETTPEDMINRLRVYEKKIRYMERVLRPEVLAGLGADSVIEARDVAVLRDIGCLKAGRILELVLAARDPEPNRPSPGERSAMQAAPDACSVRAP